MTSPTHYLPHLSTPFQQKFSKEFSKFIDPIILSWTLSDHVFVSIHSMKMPVNPIQCWFLGLLSCSINIIYSSWSFSSRSNFFFFSLGFQSTVSVQLLSHIWLLATPWTAACQASLSITNSWSFLKFMSMKSVIPSNYFILCCPLLLLSSIFPALGSFPMNQFFTSGVQSTGLSASASVFPINIQD